VEEEKLRIHKNEKDGDCRPFHLFSPPIPTMGAEKGTCILNVGNVGIVGIVGTDDTGARTAGTKPT